MSRFGGVIAGLETVRSTMEQVEQQATRVKERTREAEEAIKSATPTLDSLRQRIDQMADSPWTQELEMQLDAVAVGAGDLERFIALWGDVQVQTEKGNRSIRELLDGGDLREVSQQIQDLIGGLKDSEDAVGEIFDFIESKGGFVAEMVGNLREAGLGAEALIARLQALRAALPEGGELDALFKALEQELQNDGLG